MNKQTKGDNSDSDNHSNDENNDSDWNLEDYKQLNDQSSTI